MKQEADMQNQVLWGRREISAPVEVVTSGEGVSPEVDLRRQTLWNMPAVQGYETVSTKEEEGDDDFEKAYAGIGTGTGLNVSFGESKVQSAESVDESFCSEVCFLHLKKGVQTLSFSIQPNAFVFTSFE